MEYKMDKINALEFPYTKGISLVDDHIEYGARVIIPENRWTVIRVDGHNFKRFAKPFKKIDPFHPLVTLAMKTAMEALIKEFSPKVAYTQSDEITLVIDPAHRTYSGRTCKLASLSASIATMAFDDTMNRNNSFVPEELRKASQDGIYRCNAIFDGRAYAANENEIAGTLRWRQRDCVRNSISSQALRYFSTKQLLGKNSDQRLEMLRELGHPWEELPFYDKYGIIAVPVLKEFEVDIEQRRAEGASERELANIAAHDGHILRSVVTYPLYPPLKNISNLMEVLLEHKDPILRGQNEKTV